MSSRGWIGRYCPNCFSKESRYKNYRDIPEKDENGNYIYDNISIFCPDCNWEGRFGDLINDEYEFKNIRRTKLIDEMTK